MQATASHGPIAVINVSEYRCDAILIELHQIQNVFLPRLKSKHIQDRVRRGDLGSPETLEWLWVTVARPVLETLGFTGPPADKHWPHVWWVPTGLPAKFPLQAAGRHYLRSSKTVLDRVVSSYSPSVRTIIDSRRRPVTPPALPQALLVAMERTPGYSKLLPFANKEVAMLRSLFKSMAFNPIEPRRRKQDILSQLPKCQIFHFAGPGATDNDDPSRSRLLLEDWATDPLTVAALLDTSIRGNSPFLAYLSACRTGEMRNERFVDESIHLIGACQLAGFRHVVGTLWKVNDEICGYLARITYERIGNGGMTGRSVSLGLHSATRELRDSWLNVLVQTRRSRASVTRLDIQGMDVETPTGNSSPGNQRDNREERDIISYDDEDAKKETEPLPWVPHVHFGV